MMKNNMMAPIKDNLLDTPSPSNLSTMWNLGSLAGTFLAVQIASGLFLAMFYTSDISTSFMSVDQIMRNVNGGWSMRLIHANGGSFMFLCLYAHIGRTMYYNFFIKSAHVWESGVTIFILTMATAFFGYILPWGQMSFWGATVITNLASALPFIGPTLVQWIWGGFAVDAPTLTRFFAIHFLCPFLIFVLMMIHLILLHIQGSSNPLMSKSDMDKIKFHPYFTIKDILGIFILLLMMGMIILLWPYVLMEPDNFLKANPLSTPAHIQPEWYFLFAYSILRAIPNKLGGVIALAMSLLILFILPKMYTNSKMLKLTSSPAKFMFWWFVVIFLILTWIGACPVEYPFETIGKISSILYFMYFITMPMMSNMFNKF